MVVVQLASVNVFFVPCDNRKKFIVALRFFNRHVVSFFEESVLHEVRIVEVTPTITVRC